MALLQRILKSVDVSTIYKPNDTIRFIGLFFFLEYLHLAFMNE